MTAETWVFNLPGGAESNLLAFCARSTLDPALQARVATAVAGPIDWDRVLSLAERHGLMPLLHRHLDGLDEVPAATRGRLWARHEATRRRNLDRARELLEVTALFDAKGIASLPYKGPALAQSLHGNVAMREFGDLDILVAPRDLPRARQLLIERGYRPTYALSDAAEEAMLRSPLQYHLCLEHETHGMIELHWKTDPDYPVERSNDPAWWSALPSTPLLEASVRTFATAELATVLCIHGSKHRWTSLAWLVDVAELMHRGGVDWEEVLARAARGGYERRVALGLMLAAAWLDAPLEPALKSRLLARKDLRALARRVEATLFADALATTLDNLRFDLDLYETPARRARHLVAHVTSPNISEWTRWNLPRPLAFLYAPLRIMRLSAKYLRR